MRRFNRSLAAAVLAVILAFEPAFAYAEDLQGTNDGSSVIVSQVQEDVSFNDEEIVTETVDVSENDEEEAEVIDVSSNDEEATEEIEDVSSNEEIADVSENDEDNSDVSANDETWYKIPEGYVVSSFEKELKADMKQVVDSMFDFQVGTDYISDRVFALVETEEEAEIVADAYASDIVSFEEGVVVLDIPDEVSVAEAVAVGADMQLAMPVVYPDFIRYATEITEEDLEAIAGDYTSVSEGEFGDEVSVDLLTPGSVYGDPYLKGNAGANYQWHHEVVGSAYAWKNGYTGSGVKVAVLDTGIAQSHNDLNVAGYYNMTGTGNQYDHNGHGTHCAGIIAGKANNSLGVGVAPNATLYGVKVLGDNGSGGDSAILSGINKAIGLNVDIISMSLGSPAYSTSYKSVLQKAYEQGIAVIAASGNDGGKLYCYPASYDHVIAVAATDKNNKRASFSNYSNKVDLSAPGVDIPSANVNNASGYVLMSGTSMATPVVAGEAAVILSGASKISSLSGKSGKARVDALESLMKKSAKSAGSGMGKGITYLPKALGISTDISKPSKPAISANVYTNYQSADVYIVSKNSNTIYYTTDGSNPSYKAGVAKGNKYTGPFRVDPTRSASVTIKAIEVNGVGVASPVVSKKITLKPWVTSIAVSGLSYAAPGKTVSMSAKVTPTFATNKGITWSVTPNDGNVTIDAKGKLKVSANATVGTTYTVIAKAKDAGGVTSAPYYVKVKPNHISSIKFLKKSVSYDRDTSSVSVNLFDTTSLVNVASADGANVLASDFTWTSSNPNVATVNTSGVIYILGGGSTKITAKAKDTSGKSASITVKVNQLVTDMIISGQAKLAAGTSGKYICNIVPSSASNKKVTWTVEGNDKVKIDKNGKVTIGKDATGSVKIIATSKDKAGRSKYVVVGIAPGKITGFGLEAKSGTIFRNKGTFNSRNSIGFNVVVNGAAGFDSNLYTYTVSNPGLVSVSTSKSGNVVTVSVTATGRGTGKSEITFKSIDGSNKSAKYTVSILEPTTALTIAPSSGGVGNYVVQGKSLKLQAKATGEGKVSAPKLEWSLETKAGGYGVTVDSKSGKVSATKSASARCSTYYVTARAVDGSNASATYEVTVITPTTVLGLYGYYPSIYRYYITRGGQGGFYLKLTGNTFYNPADGYTYYADINVSVDKPNTLGAQIGADSDGLYVVFIGNSKGTGKITVKTAGGKSYTFKMEVK